jgi:hypothetical protein
MGKIYLKSLAEVAEFISEYQKSGGQHEFEVVFVGNGPGYSVTFN